uniref:hypothetical protein n=1 Tax=Trichocoleus desertorum TaxID=1481672 RepID=UPI0025B4F0C5|nr:hypothetical protein [Trichocoleus desertorum]
MLELEIGYNLTLLSNLKDVEYLPNDPRRFSLHLISCPPWYRKTFDSQMETLPRTLSEKQIMEVFKFYSSLDTLTGTYGKLLALEPIFSDFGQTEKKEDFYKQQEKFRQLIQEILTAGNPLSSG